METERQLELSRLEVQLLREQLALQKLEISKQQAKTKSVEVGFYALCSGVQIFSNQFEFLFPIYKNYKILQPWLFKKQNLNKFFKTSGNELTELEQKVFYLSSHDKLN